MTAEEQHTIRVHTLRHSPDHGWSAPFPHTDPARTLVACFGASGYFDDADPLLELTTTVGGETIGCSTAGEIHGSEIADSTLSVAVVEFGATELRQAVTPITAQSSFDAGISLAQQLIEPALRAVLVVSDGLGVNGTDLVRGINAILPPDVVVTGGLAGDGPRFERTWVLVDGKPASGFATAVGLYGDAVRVGHGSRGGWDRFGPERTVTKSRGNVVYELDGRSILELYREYLGELADELPASGLLFPLAVRAPGEDKELVRTILGVDDVTGSMTFAGDVLQGNRVRLMQTISDRLVDGAEDAAESAVAGLGPHAALSIAISCVGRRLVLGERAEDELEAVVHVLSEGIPQVGFYSYGEISPYATGRCDLHNQTMTITTLGEAP